MRPRQKQLRNPAQPLPGRSKSTLVRRHAHTDPPISRLPRDVRPLRLGYRVNGGQPRSCVRTSSAGFSYLLSSRPSSTFRHIAIGYDPSPAAAERPRPCSRNGCHAGISAGRNAPAHDWHRRNLSGKTAMLRRLHAPAHKDRKISWSAEYTTGPAVRRDIRGPIDEKLDSLASEDPHDILTYPTMALAPAERAGDRWMRFSNLQQPSTVGELLTPQTRSRLCDLWCVPIEDVHSDLTAV